MEQVHELLCRLKEKIFYELESLTLHCQKCGCESTEETVN